MRNKLYRISLRKQQLRRSFKQRVHEVVKKIQKGETLTYKQVAIRVGSPLAFRAVGTILSKNYDRSIPCHRVIRSDGTPGGYNRGSKRKAKLLAQEKHPK